LAALRVEPSVSKTISRSSHHGDADDGRLWRAVARDRRDDGVAVGTQLAQELGARERGRAHADVTATAVP
jgi:hypothetical protein